MTPMRALTTALITALFATAATGRENGANFEAIDVFSLEYAADPQISPDGGRIAYARISMDIMTDRRRANIWEVDVRSGDHRPLLSGTADYSSPRWSPDGTRLAYISRAEGAAQIYVRWTDTGQVARVTDVTESPGSLAWSPDGRWLAFTLHVPAEGASPAAMPKKPDGAEWAPPVTYIDRLVYRGDGQGYLEPGFSHVFVVPADGGAARQITSGDFDHAGPMAWAADSGAIFVSANRHANNELDPQNSEIYRVSLADGATTALTDREGPDEDPAVSADGRRIAYLGFDDRYQGYQVTELYVMDADGANRRSLTSGLDRSVAAPTWRADGRAVYFLYNDHGITKLAQATLAGDIEVLAEHIGGTAAGRPYGGGSFSAAKNNALAFNITAPDHPADLAVRTRRGQVKRLTRLNDDLFGHKSLGEVERITYASSLDGLEIEGWLVKPPGFDPEKKYPLILEIHGGPFADYGPRFTAELQLMAAAGYVVLYTNPRGSSSYGEAFGNAIHHAYPGGDYDDLMSGVDVVIARGYVDPDQLFVTGGSGGGVLTAWIVGKTGRFKAAVVAKPVINWQSFSLTADEYNFFYKYWFPGAPWEVPEHYWQRSPLSLVGNVTTPTLLLSGEADFRTPISETEQYYQALKLRGIETAMVRIPGAPHGIAGRPSNLIAKVANILAWFERYRAASSAD